MFNYIKIKLNKLTAKTLIAFLIAGGLITKSGNNQALAANSCPGGNNGHGNNAPYTHYLESGKLTIGHYDPSNPGQNKSRLISDLDAGIQSPNLHSNRPYDISYIGYDGSTSYNLTNSEATEIVNSHPDWEIHENDNTKLKSGCGDQDNDGIDDAIEVGSNFNLPLDTDNDSIPNYLDTDSDGDDTPDAIEGLLDQDGNNIPDYLDSNYAAGIGEQSDDDDDSYGDGDDSTVSLELVLSVDVSASVSGNHDNANGEYRKQVDGYIAAFNNQEVQDAIKSLDDGMVVNMQFWADQNVVDIGWFKLEPDGDDIDGLDEFIAAIDDVKRNKSQNKVKVDGGNWVTVGSGTDIKMAIDEAVSLLESNNYTGDRLVIDVSGDGIPDDTPYPEATKSLEYGYKNGDCGYTFDCPPVVEARDAAIAKNITINGLPINNSSAGIKTGIDIHGNPFSVSNLADRVDEYYMSQVVGGENSFSLLANGFNDFERAARLKILKEITPPGTPDDPGCDSSDGCESPNTAPVANDDAYEVKVETSNTLDVIINDTDVDGDTLIISGFEIADNAGELEIINNQLVYTAPETEGTYTFIYEVYDGNGGVDTAEVEVEVIKMYAD